MLAVRLLDTQKDGKGTKYTDKQAVTLKGDITLYAQWKRDPACKADLVYDKNSPDATGETAATPAGRATRRPSRRTASPTRDTPSRAGTPRPTARA
ncbi:MAG: hypothetical protein ACLS6O_00010 [Bifidobacterium sp.]